MRSVTDDSVRGRLVYRLEIFLHIQMGRGEEEDGMIPPVAVAS